MEDIKAFTFRTESYSKVSYTRRGHLRINSKAMINQLKWHIPFVNRIVSI